MSINKKKLIIILSAGIVLLSGIAVYAYNKTQKKAYDYSNYYVEKKNIGENLIEEEPEIELSLALLEKANSDVKGIIEFDDRVIYEPIVQAPDNEYYVRRNIDKEYASAGIPFISGDGTIYSKNVVIYGHSSTKENIIFTPLMRYKEKAYYLEHPTFEFITDNDVRTYEIFAVLNVDTIDPYDTLEFANTSWRKESSFESFIIDVKSRSLYLTGVSVDNKDSLITLVTCDTENNSKRIVIIAKKISINKL